ncbi:MAG: hypothetical protein A2Z25_07060 [Planctomycetes bacterium RBG_16_55_9]|nr:MAG: hypothetical protein A2Z25_07060 [Planctomycetes bacterium RBG_16_55_9]
MRIPLTKYGWPQVAVFPAAVLLLMAVLPIGMVGFLGSGAIIAGEVILLAVLIWTLTFFRDPHRHCPSDGNLLLAPADGKITDIEQVDESGFIDGPALRIGIFLSIFNVHINRAPCRVRVETITHKEGRYRNAMNPQSGRVNESNTLALVRTDHPQDRLVVRQISGAIARRIVCDTAEGEQLTGGQKFGMIKFGSRTELVAPVRVELKCLVRIGDKVKAGLTPLMRYET